MNRRVIFGILSTLVVIGVLLAVGGLAFNMGVARGLADSGKLVAPPAGGGGVAPYYYGAPYFFPRPFGFGFGFLGCLFPLLGIFLVFVLVRTLVWRGGGWGGRRWGGHGWGGPE